MGSLSRFHKITIVSLGAVGGGIAYYNSLNTNKNEKKFDVHNSWTTNYTPTVKWDRNWDHREPESIVKPRKNDSTEEDNKFNEKLEKSKSKAVRHIFLIRHGQYNIEGETDKERILTELGRPRKRWRDDLDGFHSDWQEISGERKEWKQMGETFAQQWDSIGRTQAEETGKRLACLDIKWDLLVRSTMTRAQETAKLIAKHLDKAIEVKDCQLIEEGAPVPPEPPVGHWRPEPRQFFQDGARIEAAFRRYFHRAAPEQEKDSYTLMVCHANVIRFFVCKALQFPPEGWLRISLNHGSITWVSILPNGNVVLRTLSDTGHMEPKIITSR